LLLAVLVLVRWLQDQREPGPPEVLGEGLYQVARVIDGDTLELTNRARVRLIGVDTPETVKPNHPVEPWGPEAAEFTRRFVSGSEVRLEFDHERADRHGRFLAYVWVGQRLLNEELIRAGLGRFEPHYRYSRVFKERLRRAEREAKAEKRGIWSGEQMGRL